MMSSDDEANVCAAVLVASIYYQHLKNIHFIEWNVQITYKLIRKISNITN